VAQAAVLVAAWEAPAVGSSVGRIARRGVAGSGGWHRSGSRGANLESHPQQCHEGCCAPEAKIAQPCVGASSAVAPCQGRQVVGQAELPGVPLMSQPAPSVMSTRG
jgi:hypothetical protein